MPDLKSIDEWIHWARSGVPRNRRPPEFFEAENVLRKAGLLSTKEMSQNIVEFEPAVFTYSKHDGHYDLRILKAGAQNYWFGWPFQKSVLDTNVLPISSRAFFAPGKGELFSDLRWMYQDGYRGQKILLKLRPAVLHSRAPDLVDFSLIWEHPYRYKIKMKRSKTLTISTISFSKPMFGNKTMELVSAQKITIAPQMAPGNPVHTVETPENSPIPWPIEIRRIIHGR